jgi:ElaB/YqjD/DUF883 family membrane-anchored ribosome-binding protein
MWDYFFLEWMMNDMNDPTIAHQVADVVDDVSDGIKSAVHQVSGSVRSTASAVRDAAGRAAGVVGDRYEEASQYARDSFDRTRARARSMERSLESCVRDNPKTSLLVAAALGAAIAGLWYRRRWQHPFNGPSPAESQLLQEQTPCGREITMSIITSDEALSLLRNVASGRTIPRLKNPYQRWSEETVELFVDGWKLVIFTDNTRSRHVDSIASTDGRRGEFKTWRSDVEFSQQPEDRLYREDNDAVDRMFQAFRRAR